MLLNSILLISHIINIILYLLLQFTNYIHHSIFKLTYFLTPSLIYSIGIWCCPQCPRYFYPSTAANRRTFLTDARSKIQSLLLPYCRNIYHLSLCSTTPNIPQYVVGARLSFHTFLFIIRILGKNNTQKVKFLLSSTTGRRVSDIILYGSSCPERYNESHRNLLLINTKLQPTIQRQLCRNTLTYNMHSIHKRDPWLDKIIVYLKGFIPILEISDFSESFVFRELVLNLSSSQTIQKVNLYQAFFMVRAQKISKDFLWGLCQYF